MSENISARTLAFDAVVRVAIEKSQETSLWHRRFDSAAVARRLEGDVSGRTIRRALKDAEGLGWVEKSSNKNKWEAGEKAKEYAPVEG